MAWDDDNVKWEKYSDAVERLGPQWGSTGNSEFRNQPVNNWGISQSSSVPFGPQSRYSVGEMSDDEYLRASPYGRYLREKLRNYQAENAGHENDRDPYTGERTPQTWQRASVPGWRPDSMAQKRSAADMQRSQLESWGTIPTEKEGMTAPAPWSDPAVQGSQFKRLMYLTRLLNERQPSPDYEIIPQNFWPYRAESQSQNYPPWLSGQYGGLR